MVRSVLADYGETSQWPDRIRVDSVGAYLHDSRRLGTEVAEHLRYLKAINSLSNAYKHSILQPDVNLMGADEPVINAIEWKGANRSCAPVHHSVALSALVSGYDDFAASCRKWLSTFSEEHRTTGKI